MPLLDRPEDAFHVECETVPLSSPSLSPSASGDFGKDSKLSSYGSTDTSRTTSLGASTGERLLAQTVDTHKDPEQSPLLGAVLPPPGGWSGLAGLSSADIIPLAADPFWCRLRACFFALFWAVMAALLASVVVIVVNDPQPCSARPPTLNVSLPVSALQALQAVPMSRY